MKENSPKFEVIKGRGSTAAKPNRAKLSIVDTDENQSTTEPDESGSVLDANLRRAVKKCLLFGTGVVTGFCGINCCRENYNCVGCPLLRAELSELLGIRNPNFVTEVNSALVESHSLVYLGDNKGVLISLQPAKTSEGDNDTYIQISGIRS